MGYLSNLTEAIGGSLVTYQPTQQIRPGLIPHLVELDEQRFPAVIAIDHGKTTYDYHLVKYPSLESLGYFQEDEVRVLGVITNYL